MSNLAPQAPIPRVPLFLEGEGRAEMNYNGNNNNNGSQMSGDVTESSAYKRGGASGASTLSMYDNNGYGSGPGAPWRSWGPDDWASSAKMWQQSYGNYSAAAQHWAASTAGASANSSAVWYGGDRQRYEAGFNAGASYTGGFSPETDSRAGVGETVDQAEEDEDEEETPLDVPDEWKDNPAKMIMMGVEVTMPKSPKKIDATSGFPFCSSGYVHGHGFACFLSAVFVALLTLDAPWYFCFFSHRPPGTLQRSVRLTSSRLRSTTNARTWKGRRSEAVLWALTAPLRT